MSEHACSGCGKKKKECDLSFVDNEWHCPSCILVCEGCKVEFVSPAGSEYCFCCLEKNSMEIE